MVHLYNAEEKNQYSGFVFLYSDNNFMLSLFYYYTNYYFPDW